jgi:hypothetical protein
MLKTTELTREERLTWFDKQIEKQRENINNLRNDIDRAKRSIDSTLDYIDTLKEGRRKVEGQKP